MVLFPGCACCCSFKPIGLTSSGYDAADRDSNMLLSEIRVTVSTSPPGESGSAWNTCNECFPTTNPKTYRDVAGRRNAVPSSATYVLTKYVESRTYAAYSYLSEALWIDVLAYKQSYICATVSPGSQYTDMEISFYRIGSRVSYTAYGTCFSPGCYEIPTQLFLASLGSNPANSFGVIKKRTGQASSYTVAPPQRHNVVGVKVLDRPAAQFDPLSTVAGPITEIPCEVYAPVDGGKPPSADGYTIGPTNPSFYDFTVTAVECVYSGGLPSRSAFDDE